MILLKVYYHLVCWMKIFIYKMIYGKRLTMPMNCSFRSGFHLVIESLGGGYVLVITVFSTTIVLWPLWLALPLVMEPYLVRT